MAKVFIAYRRADSATFSGRIYDRLIARYGKKNIFKDVDDIPPGADFGAYIQTSLAQCAVALIIIGQHWLDTRAPDGRLRLENASDWIRVEVETALALGLRVIPVLVDGASMPSEDMLPATLQPLTRINALTVRNDPDFNHDMERLLATLKQDLVAHGPIPFVYGGKKRLASTPRPATSPALSSDLQTAAPPDTREPSGTITKFQPLSTPLPEQVSITPIKQPAPTETRLPSLWRVRGKRRRVGIMAGLVAGGAIVAIVVALVGHRIAFLRGLGSAATPTLTVAPPDFLTAYPLPSAHSQPNGITDGPDGAVWFTEDSGNKIGRITASGYVTEYPILTANSHSVNIATGPDSALWFTEGDMNKIGRINSIGKVSEYAVPTADSHPVGIVSGPDYALWFTEVSGDKIGRVTPNGTVTEFTVPTANSHPVNITDGPDGALWFTEELGNKIGRITTIGSVTEFSLPTANSQPNGIVTGPDGALWFAEVAGNKIGRITSTGKVTEYLIPTRNSQPVNIATGPDGALWFAEVAGNKIGRITTRGRLAEFPVPTANSVPVDIVSGPGGLLWFTEAKSGLIGRIAP